MHTERKLNLKQNMLYNTAGSLIYLACQWLTTIFVVRLASFEDAGILSLSMASANMLTPIASFGMRNYQVSDLSGTFSDGTYVSSRIISSFACALASLIYIFAICEYKGYPALCIFTYQIFYIPDAILDVFHGIDQRCSRMDIIGISLGLRGILMLSAFCAILVMTGSLLLAVSGMAAISFAVLFVYDLPYTAFLKKFRASLKDKRVLSLFRACAPLMLTGMFLSALVSIPRSFLGSSRGAEALGYYSSVATPAVIVQIAAQWIFTPFTVPLTKCKNIGDRAGFMKQIKTVILIFAVCLLVIMLGAVWLGDWGLELLFGEKILDYSYLLVPVIGTTLLIASLNFLSLLLTIFRRLDILLITDVLGVIIALCVSNKLTSTFGMDGVNYSIFAGAGFVFLLQTVIMVITARTYFKEKTNG